MKTYRTLTCSVWLFVFTLLAMPAIAQEGTSRPAKPGAQVGTIYNGVDLWRTPSDGTSFMEFAENPIPAGFFCSGSEPFTGTIFFRGVPLATAPENAFDQADTVVQRLDDATFNAKGVARTRIQFKALSLASIEPIETGCGLFNVSASLHGEQPTTEMKIVREHATGGHFVAPLELNVKLVFTPVNGENNESLEVFDKVRFPGISIPWTSKVPLKGSFGKPAFVRIDSDGDSLPDTFVPGTSNFDRPRKVQTKIGPDPAFCQMYPWECSCHLSGGCQPCVWH